MKIHIKIILPIIVILFLLILLVGCLPGLLTPPPPKGVICGRIMVPSSETTKDITGWIPVANATVTLTDSSGITHTVTTDEDGYYTFTDIAVNANTIITATAVIDGNTVIVKDVIPQAVAADEDYNAKTADAESTALALIVEELLEQEIDPKDINLEEIQDSDNFTEVVGQVTSVLEENGNVTTDHSLTFTVGNVAEDIISPPAYTPPEPPPEPPPAPAPAPEPEPEIVAVKLTKIVVDPDEMTLFVGQIVTEELLDDYSITAYYNDESSEDIDFDDCEFDLTAEAAEILEVSEDEQVVTAVGTGTFDVIVSYTEGVITRTDNIVVTVTLPESPSYLQLGKTGTGTAEWTTETAEVGIYSVKLHWPDFGSRASINIDIPEGMKISDITNWSYWGRAPKYYMPQATFYVDHSGIDNPDGKDYDTTITSSFGDLGNETWIKVDQTTIPDGCPSYGSYVLWVNDNTAPTFGKTWTDIQEGFTLWGEEHDFGDSIVKHLKIGKGVIGTSKDITAYVDDFTINGITYEFEPK